MLLLLSLHSCHHSAASLRWSITYDHNCQSLIMFIQSGAAEKDLWGVSLGGGWRQSSQLTRHHPRERALSLWLRLPHLGSLRRQWVLLRGGILSHFTDWSNVPEGWFQGPLTTWVFHLGSASAPRAFVGHTNSMRTETGKLKERHPAGWEGKPASDTCPDDGGAV